MLDSNKISLISLIQTKNPEKGLNPKNIYIFYLIYINLLHLLFI